MKYVIDHDYHLHSYLSECSSDPEQTPESMIKYAKEKGLGRIILTDHFWDESVAGASSWYSTYHKYSDISRALPLPRDPEVEMLFGCETDMDKNGVVGISKERAEDFDFIIVATTHMHMKGFTVDEEDYCNAPRLAKAWVDRFDALMRADLPFHKMGVAHLTTICIAVENGIHLEVIRLIPDTELERLFTKAAELGLGIELNACDFRVAPEDLETVLHPYRIAKACGCKFYLGTDSHKPREYAVFSNFETVIDLLGLTEDDKFILKQNPKPL
jgi:histidinol phosphatase-like PHP family hydrolase